MKSYMSAMLVGLSILLTPLAVQAEITGKLEAAIWIDPDGCEHWVIDLGVEGMMSPHLDRDGNPVCNRNPSICMEFPGDMLFDVNKAVLTLDARTAITKYFTQEIIDGQSSFLVVGHTDSDGSLYDNFDLAWARAQAVAEVARQTGAIIRTDAFGELQPIASNDTADGKRRNRRVEIVCE